MSFARRCTHDGLLKVTEADMDLIARAVYAVVPAVHAGVAAELHAAG